VVYSISGRGNELWVGRQHGGLTFLNTSGGSHITKTYTEADGLAQNSVYAVYQSRDGTVWAGTLGNGVSAFRNGRFTNYTTANGLASNVVTSITESPDGTIWIATSNGLSSFSNG
jgi:ligand-binding sensor domain-containing protein